MAKDSDKKRSADNATRKFDDPELVSARENREDYPEGNYTIESPYGKTQVDIGNMEMVEGGTVTPGGMASGAATGDDGNTGSSASRP